MLRTFLELIGCAAIGAFIAYVVLARPQAPVYAHLRHGEVDPDGYLRPHSTLSDLIPTLPRQEILCACPCRCQQSLTDGNAMPRLVRPPRLDRRGRLLERGVAALVCLDCYVGAHVGENYRSDAQTRRHA